MSLTRSELLAVLAIGHEASMRGDGVSMREALARVGYSRLRATILDGELLPLLKADPKLVQQWVAYSEDKRTDGGWYVTRSGEIGTLVAPRTTLQFNALEEAVAAYVLRELDFWADLNPLPGLTLLLHVEEGTVLLGKTSPPRLFANPHSVPGEPSGPCREIADSEAGELVRGNPAWMCPDVESAIRYLVDCWCERRCIRPLARILSAWPNNGLTDGAHELLDAVRQARTAARDDATSFEYELLTATESALSQRVSSRR
jgi:hypothetical protein